MAVNLEVLRYEAQIAKAHGVIAQYKVNIQENLLNAERLKGEVAQQEAVIAKAKELIQKVGKE